MKVTILGTGAYGLALSLMFNKNTKDITMWTKFTEEKELLLKKGGNDKLLPKIKIPKNVTITTDLKEALTNTSLVVIAIPTAFVSDTLKEVKKYITKDMHFLIASKGIEQESCLFVHEIVKDILKTSKYAVISGPSFAIDMANNSPIGLSLASPNKETRRIVKDLLASDTIKLRDSKDVIGIEICGAKKKMLLL